MKTPFLYKKSTLKITACILGYSVWIVMSSSYPITTWFRVPLYFYNVSEQLIIDAPATVNIQVCGPRSVIRQLRASATAVHINATELHEGINKISLSSAMLFLPPTVQIFESTPRYIEISITKKDAPAAIDAHTAL